MKNTRSTKVLSSVLKHGMIGIAISALFFVAFQHPVFAQWTQASGIPNSSISCVAASGTIMVACAASKPDTIFVSTSNGTAWAAEATNVPIIATSIVNVGTSFIVGSDRPGGSVYSVNFGSTWNSNDSDLPNNPHTGNGIFSLAVMNNIIFAATAAGVCQQTSAGSAWTFDTVGMTFGSGVLPTIVCFLQSGANIFAGTQDAGAYLSMNSGASWLAVNNGLPASYYYGTTIDGFFSMGSTVYAAVPDTDGITTGIYSTVNNGTSWTRVNDQPQNWGVGLAFVASGTTMFAATDSGVYYSINNGAGWIQANQGLPRSIGNRPYVTSIDTSGGNLVVGTFSNGVWIRKLSDFGGASVSTNINAPSNAGLSLTITENPASDAGTKIVYSLNSGGQTQILLMDELGRTVRMLQNGYASAGTNQISFDPLMLEPGTYFVRVTANGTSAMQKLVVTR